MALHVRVLAFARLRELLGHESELELRDGANARDAFAALVRRVPELSALAATTRLARNGRIVQDGEALADGDEIALLPPVGGG